MNVVEISGFKTGTDKSGVTFLAPTDAFERVENGFIHRQVLQSRQGITNFADRLDNGTRVMGLFEWILPDQTKELLAFDTNNLYKYNNTTNAFDLVPFGGSIAAYTGFNLTSSQKEEYISVAGYPDKDNNARLIICGNGLTAAASGSSIFFYDGSNVLDYTSVADNPQFNFGTSTLTRATYVRYFNGRINFVKPTLSGVRRNSSVLYSGINDSKGNGDKFSVAGAGVYTSTSRSGITGCEVLGQELILQFENGAEALGITRDAFNPYEPRNIPSFIATSAPFSTVGAGNFLDSIGRDGILQTEGRQSLRIDNKLPNFTRDEIDPTNFDYTYGGFDRLYGHFLWSYLENGSSNTTQDKVLVRNYEEDSWSIYDLRLTTFVSTEIGQDVPWNQIEASAAHPTWGRWDTTEEIWNKIGIGDKVKKTLAGDDLGFVYEMNSGFDDYTSRITAITQAANAVLTVEACAFQAGDEVVIENVEGMTEINNFDSSQRGQINVPTYTVISATPTSVTLNVDSSTFTAYTSGGTISKTIDFKATTIPFNPFHSAGRRVCVEKMEFYLTRESGVIKIDVLSGNKTILQDAIVRPDPDGDDMQWVPVSINRESDFLKFVYKQNSPAQQLQISAIRIYFTPGGMTSG
jgi:hypothetical protein